MTARKRFEGCGDSRCVLVRHEVCDGLVWHQGADKRAWITQEEGAIRAAVRRYARGQSSVLEVTEHPYMDSDKLASIYAQVVNGVSKAKSPFVTDAESSKAWDTIAAEVKDMRAKNPKGVFSIPNELPTV